MYELTKTCGNCGEGIGAYRTDCIPPPDPTTAMVPGTVTVPTWLLVVVALYLLSRRS
jgi:hypothetical protein